MSTFLSKLFPGSGSSSSDLGSMESLCAAINNLMNDKSNSTGEKAAELVRKNKELFEKKPNDVEAFLLHCSPDVGSAAMVAAIKGMFDVSATKNNETGTDRAVELLNHYVDENNFVGEHLKLVPEIIFPLLRNVGLYCMNKKDKPEIGQRIILKALNSMFPRDGNSPRMLTSAHSVLFACALKTKNYSEVEPFIDPYVDEVANEKNVQEPSVEEQAASSMASRFSKKSQLASMNSVSMLNPTPYINPKFVLEYLVNGANVLIELKRYEDAMLLLEISVSIPAFTIQDQHIDGYKRYVLISLLLHGKINDPTLKNYAKNVKGKGFSDYKPLIDFRFSRSDKTHCKLEEIVMAVKERLKKDGNFELAKLVVNEMKKKTILSLVKMFSSIRLQGITEMSSMKTQQQTTDLIDELVREKRISVKVEGDMVFWSGLAPLPSKNEVENKMRLVDKLNSVLIEKNESMKSGSGRLRPMTLFNEDEGLSMPNIDH